MKENKFTKAGIILFLLIYFLLDLANAATYYVRHPSATPPGNNLNNGLSLDTAWATPSYAAQKAEAGDIIYVINDGYVWYDEHIVFANSGTPEVPIVFAAYGDTFILDGINETGIAIKIADKSYISMSGFHIKNYGIGIYGEGLLRNLSINEFVVEDMDEQGLNFNSGSLQDSAITDFTIRNTNARAISHYDFGSTDCHDVEIAHFLIEDINNEGILWENTERLHIHNGEIYNTASDGIHLYKNLNNSIVENVHIDTTGWHGIAIHDPYMNRPCCNNIIRNCYVKGASHGSIDLHSGAFNTIVENCSLIGPPYTVGIYFHNRGAGLLAQNNVIKNMHWGLFCGHTSEGQFIKDVVFMNNTVENTERYGGCAWRDTGDRILSNVSFINNTFIHCSQQSGYHNLVLVRVDSACVDGNSFIEPLNPDEPYIRLEEVNDGHIFNLKDNFTRIQVKSIDGKLEFSDGRIFTENGANQPFWYPKQSEYLLNLDETIEVKTYNMTAVPASDSATITANKFDTSLPEGEILIDITVSTNNGNNVVFNLFELTAWTCYEIAKDGIFFVICQADADGEINFTNSQWSASNNIIIKQVADTFGPTISGVNIADVTETGAVISWMTNEPATNQVEYGRTISYDSLTYENTEMKLVHSQQLTALYPENIYHFRVRSKDSNSNLGVSEDYTFITKGTDKITIYPNPYIAGNFTQDRITFNNLPKASTLRIYTISGKLIKEIKHQDITNGGNEEWDVSGVASGIYMYCIESSEGMKKGKVSIVK